MIKKDKRAAILGLRAENFFLGTMNKLGLPCKFIDDWYDFEVNGEKVEVKSTQLSIIQGNKKKGKAYSAGRYNFKNPENRKQQFEENIWVCFIIRNDEDFLIQGFCRARELNQRKYIPIGNSRGFKFLSLKEWIKKINREKEE